MKIFPSWCIFLKPDARDTVPTVRWSRLGMKDCPIAPRNWGKCSYVECVFRCISLQPKISQTIILFCHRHQIGEKIVPVFRFPEAIEGQLGFGFFLAQKPAEILIWRSNIGHERLGIPDQALFPGGFDVLGIFELSQSTRFSSKQAVQTSANPLFVGNGLVADLNTCLNTILPRAASPSAQAGADMLPAARVRPTDNIASFSNFII